MTPDLWADSAASLFAALGLLIVLRRIGAAGPGPLTARFRAALGLLAALMAVRVAGWTTGLGLFDGLTVALAGAVPLAAVALTEGLLRRHAPPALKWLALAGTLAFAVAAVLPPAVLPMATRGLGLMIYQMVVLASLGVIVLARDRNDLAAEENRAIDRMLASLALILPLLAGDFRTAGLDLPIRTAPIAILGLAWLSLGLGHATSKARHLAAGFAGVLALSAAVAGTLAGAAGLDLRTTLQAGGIVLCALLLLAIAIEAHALAAEARSDTVLRHLAHGPADDPRAFLEDLQRRAGVEAAALLSATDLADFDLPRLGAIFAADPLRTAAHRAALPPEDREQLDWLFTRFAASHALLIRPDPLLLLVVNRPAVGGAELAELELRALQRMAALVAARS
ncbi:MAG: hypothetical protein KBF78_19355 [Fuscovulum sp.]|jgi:hypothetical protein|nr:hypothetical protein [Fuscovulum sp.]